MRHAQQCRNRMAREYINNKGNMLLTATCCTASMVVCCSKNCLLWLWKVPLECHLLQQGSQNSKKKTKTF